MREAIQRRKDLVEDIINDDSYLKQARSNAAKKRNKMFMKRDFADGSEDEFSEEDQERPLNPNLQYQSQYDAGILGGAEFAQLNPQDM